MGAAPMLESMKRGLERFSGSAAPAWLESLRANGARDFDRLGIPSTKNEDWKYTSTAAIGRENFEPVLAADVQFDEAALRDAVEELAGRLGGAVAVFVDGNFVGSLSRLDGETSEPGLQIGSLNRLLSGDAASLEPHLGRCLDAQIHGFAALNSAFLDDGLVVRVAPGVAVEQPIGVLYWSTSRDLPVVSHPRNLIVAERTASVTVVEHFAGEGKYLCNAVTEVVVQDGGQVAHVSLVDDSKEGFHVARIEADLARDARFTSHCIAIGGALNRTEVHAKLKGENSEASLRGLYCLTGKEHADHHTSVEHVAPHTRSAELFKGVLDERSRGVFTGKIVIRPDAQKVESEQTNNNLLISDEAVVETRPQLEIYADDVKASHGATIGRLDADKLFYMRARGLDEAEAKRLLTYAFAGEPVDDVRNETLRDLLAAAIQGKVTKLHTERAAAIPGATKTEDLR